MMMLALAGDSEHPLRDRLHRDVPLLARNAPDRDSLRRSFNRLGESEAYADGLPQTLENDRGTLVVVESELPAAIDRKLERLHRACCPAAGTAATVTRTPSMAIAAMVTLTVCLPPSEALASHDPQTTSLVHARQAGSSAKPPARSSSSGGRLRPRPHGHDPGGLAGHAIGIGHHEPRLVVGTGSRSRMLRANMLGATTSNCGPTKTRSRWKRRSGLNCKDPGRSRNLVYPLKRIPSISYPSVEVSPFGIRRAQLEVDRLRNGEIPVLSAALKADPERARRALIGNRRHG